MGRVPFKPMYPEDLNFLSSGSTSDLLHAFVMDRDGENVNESAILIGMRVVVFRRSNYDIGSRAEVDDV